MKTEPINWPAMVTSWSYGGFTHALCHCSKCPRENEPLKPLCGFQPPETAMGPVGQLPDCPGCVAVLRDPVRRAEHVNKPITSPSEVP